MPFPRSTLNKTHEEIQLEWNASVNLDGIMPDAYITFSSPEFEFDKSTWCLQLSGKFTHNSEATTLGLARRDNLCFRYPPVKCTYGLKTEYGDELLLGTQVMKENERKIVKQFDRLSEEIAKRYEDILRNDLTLTFAIKIEVLYGSELDSQNESQLQEMNGQ